MNYFFKNKIESDKLLNRFIDYAKIWSESDGAAADSGIFPSTERQWDFARFLAEELRGLGLEVCLNDDCYVFGRLNGSENIPSTLLMAHMDTVDEVSGKNVNPVVSVEGDDSIISSDGSTLLGADDKAGVAAIVSAVEYIVKNNMPHGDIEILFSPDEETGHGMDKVPLELIKSKMAYTVDGGSEGELECECFNAWAAHVVFNGHACHTGDAKAGGMINANLMLADFIAMLPQNMRPETTAGYEGFIAVMESGGTIENAHVDLLLRSFSIEEIEKEKEIIEETALKIEKKYGGKVLADFKQQYLNMKEKIDLQPDVVERLKAAYKAAGVEIIQKPIRGGTDGSRLTELGIPTPNIFTGGHNFHSKDEWLSLNQCAKAADILINLLTNQNS